MTNALNKWAVAVTGTNCLTVSGTFVPRKKSYIVKCLIYMPQALTMTQIHRIGKFFKLYRINSIMLHTGIPQLKSYISGPIAINHLWGFILKAIVNSSIGIGIYQVVGQMDFVEK